MADQYICSSVGQCCGTAAVHYCPRTSIPTFSLPWTSVIPLSVYVCECLCYQLAVLLCLTNLQHLFLDRIVCRLNQCVFFVPHRRKTLWLCLKSPTTPVRPVWIIQPTLRRTHPSLPFQIAQLFSSNPLKPRPRTPKRLTTAWARLTRCPE